ncbi:MAG: STAS domain-containing protein [Nitrospinae bacterium]|nr:STAS domain-containing protein [Nitrospinota bacterium]
MKIEQSENNGVVILEPDEENFEHIVSGELKDKILKLIGEGKFKVVLNMQNIRQIRSAGLGLIVSAIQTLQKKGGSLKMCSLHDNVKEVFELCKLNQKVEVFNTENEAVKSFTG